MSKIELLREENANFIVKPLYESERNLAGKKVKKLKLEGTAIICDVVGINGRSYPKTILEPEVNRFVEKFLRMGRAAGELNHPRLTADGEGKDYSVFEMNLSKTCALIERLEFRGNELYCKMRVCDQHPAGHMLKSLVDEGYVPGFSLRGAGSVIENAMGNMEVTKDYRLITIDVVGNPSFDDKALITPVYEAMKGGKVKVLTEAVNFERKTYIVNNPPPQIRKGRRSYDRKAFLAFLESVDTEQFIKSMKG